MAYFGKYIRQILSLQEPVVFPGFGSLLMVTGKGINTNEGTIEPPGMIIKFDPDHPKSDGKLAEEYARGEEIDLEEARQQLLELVDAIKFKLDKGEVYSLDLVGTFSRDDDNRIHFEKDPNWVVDPEIFGLSSIDLLELENEEEKDEAGSSEVENETKKEVLADSSDPANASEKTASKVERKPVNKWRIIWIVIVSLIVVLALLLLINPGENGNEIEFSKDGLVLKYDTDKPSTTGLEKKSSVKEGVSQGQQQLKNAESVEQNEAIKESTSVPSQEKSYFIIAGSFQKLQNAETQMEALKSKGFPAEVIYTENRLYRVSIKSYANKADAIEELESIKSGSGIQSVWIWTNK